MAPSKQKKILLYNSLDLYKIVLDIEKYPEFIPWCEASRIIENKNNIIIADLLIRYKYFNEKFRSFVKYNKNDLKISVEYTEGPLKTLFTNWKFNEINKKKTLVEFEIDFEFKFNPLQLLINNFYKVVENKMIQAFEKRANDILK
tara:strand:+ start:267 stop:701 length:435 start_codon:yes stop_codon:yes gene_type:complete